MGTSWLDWRSGDWEAKDAQLRELRSFLHNENRRKRT